MKSDTTMHSVPSNKDILEIRNTKCNKHVNEIVIYSLVTNESLVLMGNNCVKLERHDDEKQVSPTILRLWFLCKVLEFLHL